MKTLKEQIEIMQAHLDGVEIEYRRFDDNDDDWELSTTPRWNWWDYEYRIAEPAKEKVKVNAYRSDIGFVRLCVAGSELDKAYGDTPIEIDWGQTE